MHDVDEIGGEPNGEMAKPREILNPWASAEQQVGSAE
jgi:hypothetical protein